VEPMAVAEMPMEAAAMEAVAMEAQMMADAAANEAEAEAEAVAVETMAAVEMTASGGASGGNLHGYGYAERASQHAGLKWQRCALSIKALWTRRRRVFRAGSSVVLCVLKLVVRAQETHVKAVAQRSYPRGRRGRHPVRARGCQRSASTHRGGECPVHVVGSGWRAKAGRRIAQSDSNNNQVDRLSC
jgi:hypothetical protein